jgi:hypothetical protein
MCFSTDVSLVRSPKHTMDLSTFLSISTYTTFLLFKQSTVGADLSRVFTIYAHITDVKIILSSLAHFHQPTCRCFLKNLLVPILFSFFTGPFILSRTKEIIYRWKVQIKFILCYFLHSKLAQNNLYYNCDIFTLVGDYSGPVFCMFFT